MKKDKITYINNDQPAERQCYAGGFVAPACRKHDSVMVREPVQTGQLRRSMPLQRGGKGARHNLANGRDHNHPAQLPQWILLILMPSEMAPRCLPWLVGLELRLSGPSALEWREKRRQYSVNDGENRENHAVNTQPLKCLHDR